jgi:hypothetical protein
MAGIAMKWLASAPKIASFPHVGSLISTSEHSELEVTREVMTSLRQGNAVIIAIDGAMSPAAPRVGWEGRRVTYSPFAAGLCYRLGVPSFITIPYWQDRRVKFHVEAMPAKQEGQEFPAFAQAYQDAFFRKSAAQRRHLARHPLMAPPLTHNKSSPIEPRRRACERKRNGMARFPSTKELHLFFETCPPPAGGR